MNHHLKVKGRVIHTQDEQRCSHWISPLVSSKFSKTRTWKNYKIKQVHSGCLDTAGSCFDATGNFKAATGSCLGATGNCLETTALWMQVAVLVPDLTPPDQLYCTNHFILNLQNCASCWRKAATIPYCPEATSENLGWRGWGGWGSTDNPFVCITIMCTYSIKCLQKYINEFLLCGYFCFIFFTLIRLPVR